MKKLLFVLLIALVVGCDQRGSFRNVKAHFPPHAVVESYMGEKYSWVVQVGTNYYAVYEDGFCTPENCNPQIISLFGSAPYQVEKK